MAASKGEGSAPLSSRRRPVQARGLRRREAIIDATARLLDQVGFGSVTTNAVAAEAGASIGTVYEYFPNKEALLLALLERYREGLAEAVGGALSGEPGEPWREVVGRLFDGFVTFYREEPGYRELWLGSQLVTVLAETGERWSDDFSAALAPALGLFAPSLPEARRLVVTRVAIHLVSGLVTMALQSSPSREREIIEEARAALLRYLAAELDG